MLQSLSLIIPAYNEAENIEQAVQMCQSVLPKLVQDYEIIVVNDGSADNTGEVLDRMAASYDNLYVFHHEKNRGMGAAVATGISRASKEFTCTIPADMQFDVADIAKFLPYVDTADLVIGYRVNRDYNWYRWMITYTNRFLLRLLFGLKMKDPNWVKLYRTTIFDSVSITSPGFFWDAEILIQAKRLKLRIAEVEIEYHSRVKGKASGASPKAAVKTFIELMNFWIRGIK